MRKLYHQECFFGAFTLDVTRGCLLRGHEEIKLRPKSFQVLKYLVENHGRLISKDELIQAAWADTAVTDDSLVKCLKDIRQALDDEAHQIIKTVPRRGYIFAAEVSDNSIAPATTLTEETKGVQVIIEEEETNGHRKVEPAALPAVDHVALLGENKPEGTARPPGIIYRYGLIAVGSLLALAIVTTAIVYFARPSDAIDSVAVLPFVNASSDPNTEYLSEGISDSLINSLSQLPNLKKVVPFSSVLRYEGKQIDPQAVGRELNVRTVLTGRLTQRADDLLISTELIDVRDNKRLWGEQYNRKLADVLKLQGEIAREITEKLRLRLTGEQKERLAKPQTESAEAYQLYLQARYYRRKGTDEARIKSSEYFQRAIEKDPNHALGYAGLAASYGSMANFGQMPPKEAWRKAEEAAVKALAIDDTLSEAHASLGSVKMWYDWDWPGAEREFKRAIELNPELFEAHLLYSSMLKATGRFDEAIAEVKHAYEVDPSRSNIFLGIILYQAGRHDEAIAVFQKELENGTDRGSVHLHLGEVYLKQGKNQEALAEMLKARPLVNRPRQVARIAYVYAAAGQRDEAIKILDETRGLTSERYDLGTYIASIYAALGNKEQAFAWLKRAFDDRDNGVVDLKVDPRFDALRSDPRFTDLLRRVRLAP
jgi:TolB-like protein/DNA-binding winged helix-turn-helix (wHTH) protein/predicted negative regulator of RcsB-dependent stress response